MPAQVGVSLVYSDFYGGRKATHAMLEDHLKAFRRSQVVRLCSVANFMAQATAALHQPIFTDRFLNSCFSAERRAEIVRKRPFSPGRFVFVRQSILLLLKTALAVCAEDGLDPLSAEQLPAFSSAFLMANELQVYYLPTKQEEEDSVNVLVNFVGIMEYLQTSLKNQIVRSYISVDIIEELRKDDGFRQFFDLPERFEKDLSVTIATFRSFLLGILTKPLNVKPESLPMAEGRLDLGALLNAITLSPEYFANTKLPQETVKRALEAVSATPEEMSDPCRVSRAAVYDFTELKNRPLLRIGDLHIITDIGLVAEKIETGPFWHVLSKLGTAKDRRRALAFWGHVFERYVHKVLAATVDGSKNVLSDNPLFAPKTANQQVCDLLVRCGSFLAMIECKGGFFSREAKYSGNPATLASAIEEKLIKTEDDRSMGVEQLAASIVKLFSRKTASSVDGFDVSTIKRVYPVLLLRDEIGAAPDLNRRLHKHFNTLINRKELRVQVPALFCLSNAAMEYISTYLNEIRLSDVLDDRREADKNLYMPFWLVDIAVLEKAGEGANRFFNERFTNIMNDVSMELFGQKIG